MALPGERVDVLALIPAEVGVFSAPSCWSLDRSGRDRYGAFGGLPGIFAPDLTLVLWLIYVSYMVLRKFSSSAKTN